MSSYDEALSYSQTRDFLNIAVPFSEFTNNEVACSKDHIKNGEIDNDGVDANNCLKYLYFGYFMICTKDIVRHTTKDCEYRKAELDLYDPSQQNIKKFYQEFPAFFDKHKDKAIKFAKDNNLGLGGSSFEYQRPIVDDDISPVLKPLPSDLYTVNKHITRLTKKSH